VQFSCYILQIGGGENWGNEIVSVQHTHNLIFTNTHNNLPAGSENIFCAYIIPLVPRKAVAEVSKIGYL